MINGGEIGRSDYAKYFEVYLDNKLNWWDTLRL